MVLENDGPISCLASAISCASMAILDANIEIYDTVIGCACAFIFDSIFIDPTCEEESRSSGTIVMSVMPALNQVSHIIQNGEISALQSSEVNYR